MSERLKDEILTILNELGGEVLDDDGKAVRKIFERVASTGTYSSVSTAIGELDKAGVVVRDMPNLKRTTRIAINGPGVRPGRKNLDVVMEQVSRLMADTLRVELQQVVDAHVAAGLDEQGVDPDQMADLREKLAMAEARIGDLKLALREAQQAPAQLRAQLDQARQELAEKTEKLTNTERSLESWKRNALGRPVVREMLAEVKDRLDPKVRAELERLMRELPSGGR